MGRGTWHDHGMTRAVVCAFVALLALVLPGSADAAQATHGTNTGRVAFRLADPRLSEASGIGAGLLSPGVVYLQNDSGDSARFFALNARTGRVLAVCRVPGASNVDWEDLAVARNAAGTPSVWLADIGDNEANRSSITLYRVDEPRIAATGPRPGCTTRAPQVWRLRYPGRPVDAESLAVAPGGAAYLVTKSPAGVSAVYAVPHGSRGGAVQLLQRIGTIRFRVTGTPNPFSFLGNLTATGAALSRDGTVFAVRTYSDAYLWRVRGRLAAALRATPVRVPLPAQPQGEGITFDASGRHLLIDSERPHSAVYAVPVPGALDFDSPGSGEAGPGALATASPTSSATPSPTKSAPGHSLAGRGVGGLVLLIVLVGAWLISRTVHQRRDERRRRERREQRGDEWGERDEWDRPPDDWGRPGGA